MKSKIGQSVIALTVSTLVGFSAIPAQSALLVSSGGDNSIKQYDETTGAYIRDFVTSGSGGLFNPQGLTLGPNGNLFVVSGSSVKEYSGTTGEYIKDFATEGLLDPEGLSFAPDGSLFVVSDFIPGTEVETFPGFVEWSNGLLQYDGTTGELIGNISVNSPVGPLNSRDFRVVDVVIGGPNSNLYVSVASDRGDRGEIGVYDLSTREKVGSLPTVDRFTRPGGLAVSDSELFSVFGRVISRYQLVTGGGNPVVGSASANFQDVTFGPNGNLFVSDSASDSIRQFDSQTFSSFGNFVASGSGGLSNPRLFSTTNNNGTARV
jgi:hypothetical protein